MKKKSSKVKVIVITIILCIVFGIIGYFGTLLLDNIRRAGTPKIKITFDDSETYVIPSTKKLEKEEALKEWPYMMDVENSGDAKALYQIIITDLDSSNIKRDKLSYSLVLDEKEVSEGKLSELNNDVLYTYEIEKNQKQRYKLYIWVNSELEEKNDTQSKENENKEGKEDKEEARENVYEYQLKFNTIKKGGPGF